MRYSLTGLVIGDLYSLTTPMDPQPPEPKGLISSWDENDVQLFLANLGLPQYEANVKGNISLYYCPRSVTIISSRV